ncbi:MAG: YncE family protein [Bryobacteraceae bacterium]|nr:YncE family protein [Bryobacteraceae bacterium]
MRLSLLFLGALAFAQSPYQIKTRWPIGGEGGWDYITLDVAARRLYVSHATRVEVLDADSVKVVGAIADTPGVHGIAIAGRHGFTTNGRENKLTVFTPGTLAVVKKLDVGKGPDGIFYHAATKRVFTCNHGSHDMTVVDAEKAEVIGTVELKGDGESVVLGKDGLLYVNVEDTTEVAAVDPKTMKVMRRLPTQAAKIPTGLGYDPKTNHLYIACRDKPLMVIMDAGTGQVVTTFPIGTGADWAHFDPKSKLVMSSSGDGTMGMFQQKGATYTDLGAFKTELGAKTFAFDPKTGRIFLPTADIVVTPATGEKKGGRTVTAGTFRVLVAAR